jgi:hypothetical protein
MSSERRKQSSRANGARSKGPVTPEGKRRSSMNAITHGMCVDITVLKRENPENFRKLLQQHMDRFQPNDEVELGMVEEMAGARWRMRRAWATETEIFDMQYSSSRYTRAEAFLNLGESPAMALAQRYENRQQIIYQRALRTFILMRQIPMPDIDIPNDPSPISEHPPETPPKPVQPTDFEPLAEPLILAAAGFQPAPKAAPSPHPGVRPDGNKLGAAA